MTVDSGDYWTFYSSETPPAGQTCAAIAQARVCTNGSLSGSATYNKARCGSVYFANDIDSNGSGGAYVVSSPVANSADRNLYLFELNAGSIRKVSIPEATIQGSTYNMAIAGDTIHLIGSGYHLTSTDRGATWEEEKYEHPSYPTSDYYYGVANTLKTRSGSILIPGKVNFVQELEHRVTHARSVIEMELPGTPIPAPNAGQVAATSAAEVDPFGTFLDVLQSVLKRLQGALSWFLSPSGFEDPH
jgi:hypothetical protein